MHRLVRNWNNFLNESLNEEIVFKIPFSYEPHTKLNQRFWNQPGDKLDPEIRERLLKIAKDFLINGNTKMARFHLDQINLKNSPVKLI